MRVQLSAPWNDHRAGSKVNVSRDVGRQLIYDGRARAVGVGIDEMPPPPPRSGKGSGVEAWAAYAGDVVVAGRLEATGHDVPEGASREDILAALKAAGVPTEVEPAPNPDDPDGGADNPEGAGNGSQQ